MDAGNIDKIELDFLRSSDYDEIKEVMIESYSNMAQSYWKKRQIEGLLEVFPKG